MRNLMKRIFSNVVFANFSYLTIGSVLSQLISLFTVLKITRVLNPGDYGVYTFIIAQGTLLLLVGDLGLRYVVIRSIARDPDRAVDLTVNGLLLRSLALLGIFSLYSLYNYYLGFLNFEQLILVFLYTFILCSSNVLELIFLGNQKMLFSALINIGYSITWFVLIFALPAAILSINFLLYSFIFLTALKALAFLLLLKRLRFLNGKSGNFWAASKKILKESWPYFALIVITLPVTKLSNNFLDLNSTLEQVGYYNLSDRLTGPVSMVMDFALAAIFPNLAALWGKDKDQFNNLISDGFQYYMLLGIFLSFLFTLFARDVVSFLFTSKYLPAVRVCQVQIWFLYLSSLDYLAGVILGAVNKEKTILKLGIVRAVFATPILYYGSKFGALGLSYAFVISFAIYQFYLWYVFKKTLNVKIKNAGFLWILTILFFGIAYFIIRPDMSIFYRIMLASAVIGGFVYYIFKNYKSLALKWSR